jgi:hypothetical protein
MNIKNLKIRLNLDNEADRTVYDYLRGSDLSISKEAIHTINEYLVLSEERKQEDRFLNAVTATIQENLKALVPLLNLLSMTQAVQPAVQPPTAPPEENSQADENMMDFLKNF